MKNNKIVILHVFIDGMNVTNTANDYDALPNVDNLYYYYAPQQNFRLKKIKDERVKIIRDFDEYVGYFSNPDIDVIIFYSLPHQYYFLFDYIDKNKYVVWWIWGYDIYNGQGGNPPLLPLKNMYMPLTAAYMKKNAHMLGLELPLYKKLLIYKLLGGLKSNIKNILGKCNQAVILPAPKKTQNEILSRIDAAYAPLDIEIDLLKEAQPSFKADMFERPRMPKTFSFHYSKEPGNVLVNHSLTYTVNHIDIFDALKKVDLGNNRKYIFPVSYGIYGYKGNPEILMKASGLDSSLTTWLTHLLPVEEYEQIVGTVTHAVFGMIRQQGLGNLYICFQKGVKVYLFKDSLVYRELRKMGYVIFTIEDDLTSESLSKCLEEKDSYKNYSLFVDTWNDCSVEKCYLGIKKALFLRKEV